MSRIPIRLRLTLAFALAMAIVLAATGAFLYVRLSASLDESIDESLQARAAELVPRLAEGDGGFDESSRAGLVDPDERFVQVLDESGRAVDGTSQIGSAPLVDPGTVARATAAELTALELDDVPGIAGRARVLAVPVETPDGTRVLLVGASLEDRDEAVRSFLVELLVIGPVALVLASLLGYALATAALHPVEAMRIEAAAISGAEPERRLPLPASNDEVHKLGATLNDMLARLEQALERERRFVADASHELRTPLALLETELELALRRPRSAAELERAIRSAAAEADRLARLAQDLLLLARSDQGQLTLRQDRVSATETLERVANRFRALGEADRRPIDVEAPQRLVFDADPARLEQALGNLLENSLRHGTGRIVLSAVEQEGQVELHVSDEGAGFPPAFLSQAFDRFSRADGARSGPGAGLGLAIAAAIAKAHRGSAHAANREPSGTDVWLSIPRS